VKDQHSSDKESEMGNVDHDDDGGNSYLENVSTPDRPHGMNSDDSRTVANEDLDGDCESSTDRTCKNCHQKPYFLGDDDIEELTTLPYCFEVVYEGSYLYENGRLHHLAHPVWQYFDFRRLHSEASISC
jgi:hypothetical protein